MKKTPGVSDNKSYKDQYHFSDAYHPDTTIDDLPSLNVDPRINTSIKENPYRSNVNIEKDEVVLQPDLSALFKAKGKKHSHGGIDVLLQPDSFIFSDDKTLAFTEGDHDLFEFKKGGNFKPEKNTPADVLKRNVDVKHYNTLIANITSVKKDDLAKKSSALMLEKYIQTIGGIAFLQESKKNFPQGIPPFALGTAPVYNADIKNEVMEQKQYAKYGGSVNTFLGGGTAPCPCGKDANGKCLPCSDDVYQSLLPKAKKVKAAPTDYEKLYTTPDGVQLYGKFGEKKVSNPYKGPLMPNDKWKAFLASPQGQRWKAKQSAIDTEDYLQVGPQGKITITPSTPEEWIQPSLPTIDTNTPNGPVDDRRDINWQFSPWQKVSQAYQLGKLASAKRYMPYRSHFNPSYVDPQLVNPEQAVADMKAGFNSSISGINSLSPILRNAQSQVSFGQFLNQVPGVRSQYDNQNVGIANQFRQYNNQIRNNATLQNMQNDQNYYRETVIANQNYDNLKSFLGDQYMNNLLGDVQDNQSLAYNLATLRNPAYTYDFKTGNFRSNPKRSILDVENTSNTQENLIELARQLKKEGFGDKAIGDIIKSKAFQTWNPTQLKKGGKVGNPYR